MDTPATFLVVTVALILRLGTSLHSYSGQNKPPLYGDLEAQRHWQEITVNLPPSEWYVNSTDNDLLYWGLDYPPLTAYHSFLCGKIASYINEDFIRLHSSRGLETNEHKLFMRNTVIAADLVVWFPCVLYFLKIFSRVSVKQTNKNSSKKLKQHKKLLSEDKYKNIFYLCMLLFYPGLILIDHGHFQYNCISLGFTVLTIAYLMNNSNYKAAVAFVMAINYKQMELYHAIPVFIFLLSVSLRHKTRIKGVIEIAKLGFIVIISCLLIWLPFITDFKLFAQVLHRLFPFSRGVFEDKVSNIWCALNVIIKLKTVFDTTQMATICALITLISVIPTNIVLFYYPNYNNLKLSLFNTSLSFFLFSFQVHEKSILLAAIPALLLFTHDPLVVFWFTYISTFSMLPLFIKDQLVLAYLSLNMFYALTFRWYYLECYSKSPHKNIFALSWNLNTSTQISYPTFVKLIKMVFHISILGTLLLSVCSFSIKPPAKYPDLFPLLISVISCFHFLVFLVYFNLKLFFLNMVRTSSKCH